MDSTIGRLAASLVCLLLSIVIYKFIPSNHGRFASPHTHQGTTSNSSSLSLSRAYTSFLSYPSYAQKEAKSYAQRFDSLRGSHRRWAQDIGYAEKIAAFERAYRVNARVTNGISELAVKQFPQLVEPAPLSVQQSSFLERFVEGKAWSQPSNAQSPDIGRVKEALKHLVRDWSAEGAVERRTIHAPILAELERIPKERRSTHRVLVPGSGLGRLGWEIAQLGFDTTTIELSYFMNLSLRYLLSETATSQTEEHTLHPHIHWWSHQRSNENTFRSIKVPDVLPRRIPNWHVVEDDFLGIDRDGGFDTIVTLYFIDTASNLMSYLSHIHYLLRPGGKWINLGPLLYSNAVIELSLEEVIRLAERVGFTFLSQTSPKEPSFEAKHRTIPSEYTSDQRAMMKWIYQAEFWVAQKKDEEYIIL